MSEGGVMNCGEFSNVAAELALGVLTGRERADALAHLENCEVCRETVRQLAVTGEGLVQLLPAVEPPAGFETRVMARIGIAPGTPADDRRTCRLRPRFGWARAQVSRPRRMLAAAAAALAIVAAGLGGWGLGTAGSPAAATELSSAALVSAHHQKTGEIFFYKSKQPWVYMSVADLPSGDGIVICQVAGPGGHFTTVGTFRLDDGYGAWGPSAVPSGTVTAARIIGPGGAVLATAHF
jgi:hypothetical protein